MKNLYLKLITGLAVLWPLAIGVILVMDALRIQNASLDWSGWLGRDKFFPVVFPVLMVLITFIPMVLSIIRRSVPRSSYLVWQVFLVLLAPLALPVFWYRFIWRDDLSDFLSAPRKALILFVKHPEAGEVKTRLAHALGDAEAIRIYEHLLQQTQAAASKGNWDVQVWYGNAMPEKDRWSEAGWPRFSQEGEDLGERMNHAINQAMINGYDRVVLLGSDVADLDSSLIDQAFASLEKADAVLGPAADGGYYLVGLKRPLPELFLERSWSHDKVLEEARAILEKYSRSVVLLSRRHDVDRPKDVKHLNLEQAPAAKPRT